jgi:hypothetical protein
MMLHLSDFWHDAFAVFGVCCAVAIGVRVIMAIGRLSK